MEIEKKFLIFENGINYSTDVITVLFSSIDELKNNALSIGKKIEQGYLPIEEGLQLAGILKLEFGFKPFEARLRNKNGVHYFTLKGEGNLSRNEIEEKISETLFNKYWPLTLYRRVEKVRFEKKYIEYNYEIDVYTDRDLIVGEIEIPKIEDVIKIPPLGKDITEDKRYKNKNLAK